jgi:PAS domain S-box-containing protein
VKANGPSSGFPYSTDVAFQPGDIVFATDRLGRVVHWNVEAEAVCGHSAAEVLGKPYLLACRLEPSVAIDLKAIVAGRDFAGGVRCHSRSGGDVALYLYATVGRNHAGEPAGVVFVGRDVTGIWHAEKAARVTADKYRILFESTLDAVVIAGIDGKVVEANPACLRLYGYTAEDVRGMNLADVVAPDDRGAAADAVANLALGRQVARTIRARRKDGTGFVVDLLASMMTVGGERRILWVTRDATERVRSEQARSQSELMYRTVFESANDAVFIESVDGSILDVNRSGCRLLGYERRELVKKNVSDLVPADARAWLPRVMDAILRDGTFRAEAVRVHRDGHHIPVEISAAAMEVGGRTVVLSIVRDITERKRAEQSLRESEEKFRGVAEQSPNMIFINSRGRVAYANQKSVDVMGYSREELYAPDFGFANLVAPESQEKIRAANARDLRGEEVESCECVLVAMDGRRIDAILTTRLVEYDGATAILGIVTDITERKQADRALREEKERSQTYLALAGVILVALDADGRITLLNRRGCQVLAVTESEALGRNWFDHFVPERSRARVKETFAALMAGNLEPMERYENPVLTAGGEERLVVWHNALLRDQRGRPTGTLSSGEDVTERERAYQALRESEEKYRSVVERASDGICIVQDGRLKYLNSRLAEMAGYATDELLGQQFADYLYPEDRAIVAGRYRRRLSGEAVPSTYTVRLLRGGGGELSVEVNVGMATYEGMPAEIVLVRDVTARSRRESKERYR